MSDDLFDPTVERHYGTVSDFADSPLFNAEVELRAYRRQNRHRLAICTVGGILALGILSQMVRLNFGVIMRSAETQTILPRHQVDQLMQTLSETAAGLGFYDFEVGALTGAHMLILFGLATTALFAGAAVRLSQSL